MSIAVTHDNLVSWSDEVPELHEGASGPVDI